MTLHMRVHGGYANILEKHSDATISAIFGRWKPCVRSYRVYEEAPDTVLEIILTGNTPPDVTYKAEKLLDAFVRGIEIGARD